MNAARDAFSYVERLSGCVSEGVVTFAPMLGQNSGKRIRNGIDASVCSTLSEESDGRQKNFSVVLLVVQSDFRRAQRHLFNLTVFSG
jgi:hypothetical protein